MKRFWLTVYTLSSLVAFIWVPVVMAKTANLPFSVKMFLEKKADILTFESQVTPQKLEKVNDLPVAQILQLDFVTGRPSSQQIKMPELGSFKVAFQAGERFHILDGDASDGEAKVQLPCQIFDLYIRAEFVDNDDVISHRSNRQNSLKLDDSLYYASQIIEPSSDRKWHHMPGRPIPVPEDWYSNDGQMYVLNLANTGVPKFSTRWVAVPHYTFPVGMKKIGPEGGAIELPGVAKLDIPAGALNHQTVIGMRQQLQAESRKTYCPNLDAPEFCYMGWAFAAPIVRITPLSLKLNQVALLDLPLFEYVKKYHPSAFVPTASLNVEANLSWGYEPLLAIHYEVQSIEELWKYDLKLRVQQFAYFSREMSAHLEEEFGLKTDE